MKTIGNVLWFLLGGWWTGTAYALIGILFCITIIGIPIGTALFQYAKLMYAPFGKEIVRETDIKGKKNVSGIKKVFETILNIMWLPFGILFVIMHLACMILCFISIIMIPVGFVLLKAFKFVLWPMGARVVSR